jgi:hypothetical protein
VPMGVVSSVRGAGSTMRPRLVDIFAALAAGCALTVPVLLGGSQGPAVQALVAPNATNVEVIRTNPFKPPRGEGRGVRRTQPARRQAAAPRERAKAPAGAGEPASRPRAERRAVPVPSRAARKPVVQRAPTPTPMPPPAPPRPTPPPPASPPPVSPPPAAPPPATPPPPPPAPPAPPSVSAASAPPPATAPAPASASTAAPAPGQSIYVVVRVSPVLTPPSPTSLAEALRTTSAVRYVEPQGQPEPEPAEMPSTSSDDVDDPGEAGRDDADDEDDE